MSFPSTAAKWMCAAISLHLAGCATTPQTQAHNILFYGGSILTMEGMQPQYVEALVVEDGKIRFAGSQAEANRLLSKNTQKVDLKQHLLMPAFIDAHSHANTVGTQQSVANLFPAPDGQVGDINGLIQALVSWKNNNTDFVKATNGWIIGIGYDDAQLKEKHHPTADDLDKVSKDLPVIVIHQSWHLAVVNHKAMELLNINDKTPNPSGGVIRRVGNTQTPNGILEEWAAFSAKNNAFKNLTPEMKREMAKKGVEAYIRQGFTTIQEGRTDTKTSDMWRSLAEEQQLPIDLVAYPDITTSKEYMLKHGTSLNYNQHFRLGGVKISLDGSPQGKTAWLTQPYKVPPVGKDKSYSGYPAFENPQEVKDAVDFAFKHQWQLLAHANGDAAIEQFIDAVADATRKEGKADRRSVLIHGQTIRDDQLDHLKGLDIIPSFFNLHTFYWGDWHRQEILGEERAKRISPLGSALRKDILFTLHLDSPVIPPNSLGMVDAAVNRTTRSGYVLGDHERISPYMALKALTDWSAYQYFEEKTKGTLTPGKLADLVILEQNPLTVPANRIKDIKILSTYKEGKLLYQNLQD